MLLVTVAAAGYAAAGWAASGCAAPPAARPSPPGADVVAFVGVRVLPMDRERVLDDQTVVVRAGTIAAIGPAAATTIPPGARRIEARGKTLIPGLVDAHVHVWNPSHLLLFVANGVTTVRNMWGSEMHLAMRDRIARRELFGPRLFTTTPIVDGDPPIWPGSRVVVDEVGARRVVAEARELGYDAIKVYGRLSPAAYAALIAAARAAKLPVVGHVPDAVPLAQALASRQHSIEHLTGWVTALQKEGAVPVPPGPHRMRGMIGQVDESKIPALVEATVAAGTWNVVTSVVRHDTFARAERARELWRRPEMRYLAPSERAAWDPTKDFRTAELTEEDFAAYDRAHALHDRILLALARAGARLAVGTDTPNPNVIPGFAIHEELARFVAAGLTPFQALRAATSAPAEMLGVAGEQGGTIAVGQRADLVLLEGNPLDDIHATRRRAGVMIAGRWLTQAELDAELEALAASYQHPPPRFQDLPPLEGAVRLDLTVNGLPAASERVVWRGARLVGQASADPPFRDSTRYQTDGDRLEQRVENTVGVSSIQMTRERVDLDSYGRRRQLAVAAREGTLVPPESDVAPMAFLARLCADLARPGDAATVVLVEPDAGAGQVSIGYRVERLADEGGRRVLGFTATAASRPPRKGKLIVAADGLPFQFRIEGFFGTTYAVRAP
jgi:imidazolonepropionase-like amidohydrolase